ncbi:uncharacterized protein BT62DRAFT_935001 [Guyanagaster necrorhizus]|uniref:Uncharacterized protein n=1 Tax=Guyanagaster necrorhizus TaxID=856835 RepID=A0A9P8APV0_9AGAR|nr:uncharacterized protein BT62DRAFT_935001 [Guyanagaster necrorhizus MCA 3950]KAG7443389.1 hypothetical protein BT62DRAFT_935001 [Guyanagaster necrorhizus MCA 3950]
MASPKARPRSTLCVYSGLPEDGHTFLTDFLRFPDHVYDILILVSDPIGWLPSFMSKHASM